MDRSEIQRQIDGLQAHWQNLQAEASRISEERCEESEDSRRKWLISQREEVQRRATEALEEINRLKAML